MVRRDAVANEPLFHGAPRLLGGARQAALPQNQRGFLEVAVGLGQGVLLAVQQLAGGADPGVADQGPGPHGRPGGQKAAGGFGGTGVGRGHTGDCRITTAPMGLIDTPALQHLSGISAGFLMGKAGEHYGSVVVRLAGGLATLLFALVIGVPTFRFRGAYFAMGTLALAEALRITVGNVFPGISTMAVERWNWNQWRFMRGMI